MCLLSLGGLLFNFLMAQLTLNETTHMKLESSTLALAEPFLETACLPFANKLQPEQELLPAIHSDMQLVCLTDHNLS